MSNPNAQTQTPENVPDLSLEDKRQVARALNPVHVDVFREATYTQRTQRHQSLIENSEGVSPADLDAQIIDADKELLDRNIQKYLETCGYSNDNPMYNQLNDVLVRYSPMNMSKSEWEYGHLDESGEFIPETSGKYRIEQELRGLIDEDGADTDPVDLSPELVALQAQLESTRTRLAEISLKRRAMIRKKGKKADSLRTEYESAQAEYNQAYIEMGAVSVDLLRLSGASDEDIAQKVGLGTSAERLAFTAAERQVMESDNSKTARFLRFYSKLPVMIGANVAVGAGVGYAARKAMKYGFIAAVPVAGIAGLAAVRAGKSLLTTSATTRVKLHKEFEKRSDQDAQDLSDALRLPDAGIPAGKDVESTTYAERSQLLVQQSIDKRVQKDISGNRKRAALSATIAGGATVVGSLIASGGIKLPDWFSDKKGSSLNDKLIEEGVKSPVDRANILAHQDAFERMVNNPEDFEQFMNGVDKIKAAGYTGVDLENQVHKTLGLADHLENYTGQDLLSPPLIDGPGIDLVNPALVDEAVSVSGGAESFGESAMSIPQGGGIIKNVIRPLAIAEGVSLTSSEETQLWKSVRERFGDNIFTDMSVTSRGSDQWIAKPGEGTLRREVKNFIQQQLASK